MKVVFYTDLVLLLASCGGGKSSNSSSNSSVTSARDRAINRGANFFGVTEKFNRYYTDPSWIPTCTVYVSPTSNSISATTAPQTTINNSQPGDLIQFAAGTYTNSDFQINADPLSEIILLHSMHNMAERSPIPELGPREAP